MNGLSLVQALAPAHWPTLVLVSARMVGLMLAAPLWSFAGMPKSIRGALVIVFTVTVLPHGARAAAAARLHGVWCCRSLPS